MIALTLAITYIVMAAIIVLGILFPAYRAMKVQPAIALKDE
jgi:ABC-type antimicrobial peptide transport system permease subunit